MGTINSSQSISLANPFLSADFQYIRDLSLQDVRNIYNKVRVIAVGYHAPSLLVHDILKRFNIPNSLKLTQAFSISSGRTSKMSVNVMYMTTGLCFYCKVGWRYKLECNIYAVLFNLCDMDMNGAITMDEMKILALAFLQGVACLTESPLPHRKSIVDFFTVLFRNIDISQDGSLSLEE